MASTNLDTKQSKDGSEILSTKIEELPGIGKKTGQKIIEYFGSEDSAFQALRNMHLAIVPGISHKQAAKWSKMLFELEERVSPEKILITPDIREIYENLLLILMKYTKTEFSKAKLPLFFPLPSSHIDQIRERQEYFQKALQFTRKNRNFLEAKNFSRILYHLDFLAQTEFPLKSKKENRIFLTDNSKIFQNCDEEKSSNHFHTELLNIDKIQDISKRFDQYCTTFDVVIFAGKEINNLPDHPNLLFYPADSIKSSEIFPEKTIFAFSSNKTIIDAAIKVALHLRSLKETEIHDTFLRTLDLKFLKRLKDAMDLIDENGKIAKTIDPVLDEYLSVSSKFNALIIETENEINQTIQKEIGARSIRLEGKQILDFFRADMTVENIRNYIPPEVDQLISESIEKGIEKLRTALKFSRQEDDMFEKLKPEIIEYPIVLNEEGVHALEKKVRSRVNTYEYQVKVKISKIFEELYPILMDGLRDLLEFEFFYAVGQFGMDFNLEIPKIETDHTGFYGNQMINLDLMVNAKKDDLPIPISYQLGYFGPETIQRSQLNLLTGSNSGGKTMCITTVIQALLLAQMGFPSLGQLLFAPFDEFYFFKKSVGQITAGAFETTLLQFVQLSQSDKLKVVFADELEAITEPNAAAKVMAGIFDLFLQNPKNYGVFVTHLVEFILKEMPTQKHPLLRVDGIEASGLNDKLDLVIDRNPKYNYVAKSTPELILKRLANSGSKDQRSFFTSILSKFL